VSKEFLFELISYYESFYKVRISLKWFIFLFFFYKKNFFDERELSHPFSCSNIPLSLRVCLDWGGDLREWIWSDLKGM